MKKAVLLIAIVLLVITGCSQKSSVTEQSTAMETTATIAETKATEADIFGDLGKEFFEQNIIANWKNHTIPDEQALRERIDIIYDDLSTKEDLVQEALATPRDAQPTQSQPTETQATQTPNSNTNGGSSNNGGSDNTTTSKETKATTPKETKSNTTATQAPAINPEKQAEIDKKYQDDLANPAKVDTTGGAGGVNEGAEDAAKGWQWQ